MSVHELKCWPGFFAAISSGLKHGEVRKDDRGFHVGDTLVLCEFDPFDRRYTGRRLERMIVYTAPLRDVGVPGFVYLELLEP